MIVTIEGKMIGGFQKPDYTDKDTGEIQKGKFAVQLMVEQTLKNDEIKSELVDVSIPDILISKYKGKDGQAVQIKCKYFLQDKKVTFYGV